MLTGLPIAYCMGAIFVYSQDFLQYQIVAQRNAYGINNFTLIAVPFSFAAQLMNTENRRLFRFANILVGHLPGALAVNIIASVIFAGMSGAAFPMAGLGPSR